MDLAKLLVPSMTIDAEYARFDGFEVTVAYQTREELTKLREKATTQKYNKKSHVPEEDVDSDLFQDLYIKAVVKGWKGLKYRYLLKMIPMNESDVPEIPTEEGKEPVDKLDGELDFSIQNAGVLMKNCSEFDSFISNLLDDVENFTKSS